MAHPARSRQRINKSLSAMAVALLIMLMLSACGNNSQTQIKANQSKMQLDKLLTHAQNIGIPGTVLQPILNQEAQLTSTNAPLSVFDDQTTTAYYSNLAQRYAMLAVQVHGLEYQITQQYDYQAYQDIQKLENALTGKQSQSFVEAKTFAAQLANDQAQLAKAQYPKDYIQISISAQRSTQALHLMGLTYDKLKSLQQVITQMRRFHLDTTALEQEQQNDVQLFRAANKPEDFTRLMDEIDAQLQQATIVTVQAVPSVSAVKLAEFSSDIQKISQYGQDVSKYQQHLTADQAALNSARSIQDYLKIATQIDNDVASIQISMVQAQANYLLKQFHQEVTDWGNTHVYHDPQDNNDYHLDYAYGPDGVGGDADTLVQSAQTVDDYQSAIDTINNDLTNLHALEADYNDDTPWTQPHAADLQLMQHYHLMSGQTIVISLLEQTLRLYQDGKLVNQFRITSGQYARPSPPGVWHILLRQSPTIFKSSEPPGSAFWYPNTNINFAMEYHDGGFYLHDSWWRVNYGPGTNFPHNDSGGDETFAGNGSHGCINIQEDNASWLYAHTSYDTNVVIY